MSRSLVVIDASVETSASILGGLEAGLTEVVVLDSSRDGIAQIGDALRGKTGFSSVQIFSNGTTDTLQIGSTRLTSANISSFAGQMERWRSSLSQGADVLLYGSSVASGANGRALVDAIARATGADVAASTNPTRDGEWTLEYRRGNIESRNVFARLTEHRGSLTLDPSLPTRTITVTTAANAGAGSLRDAIAAASQNSRVAHVIRFSSALAGQTISLSSQIDIPVGARIMIDGSGANGLTISGRRRVRLFNVRSTSVRPTFFGVRNLSLVDGYTAERGGAIASEHRAVLEVRNVVFRGNVADRGGGAVFSAFEGAMFVRGSRFENNQAIAGNDERGAGAIAFWGPRILSVVNSTFTGNRGINGGAINSLNGKLVIENSRFLNNDTLAARVDAGKANPTLRGLGGAIYTDRASSTSEARGSIRISGSYFENNRARAEGGAAYLFNGSQDSVSIEDTAFFRNQVQPLTGGGMGDGGALVVSANARTKGLTLNRVSFVENTASNQGGALWTRNAPATILNSTFARNRAVGGVDPNRPWTANGGAMLLGADADIVNSTLVENRAFWVGGAVSAGSSFNVTTRNSIFLRNTADNGGNNWLIQQHTNRRLINRGGNIQFPPMQSTGGNRGNDVNVADGVIISDPRLGALNRSGDRWFYPLLSGSPAINAGLTGGLTPSTDIRVGIRDARPDIGAFEADVTVFEGLRAANTMSGSVATQRSRVVAPGLSA